MLALNLLNLLAKGLRRYPFEYRQLCWHFSQICKYLLTGNAEETKQQYEIMLRMLWKDICTLLNKMFSVTNTFLSFHFHVFSLLCVPDEDDEPAGSMYGQSFPDILLQ